METQKLVEIVNNPKEKSNKDLMESLDFLDKEFNETKSLIIDLTRHLELVETYFDVIIQKDHKKGADISAKY